MDGIVGNGRRTPNSNLIDRPLSADQLLQNDAKNENETGRDGDGEEDGVNDGSFFEDDLGTHWALQVRFASDARFAAFCDTEGLYRHEDGERTAANGELVSTFGCNW